MSDTQCYLSKNKFYAPTYQYELYCVQWRNHDDQIYEAEKEIRQQYTIVCKVTLHKMVSTFSAERKITQILLECL